MSNRQKRYNPERREFRGISYKRRNGPRIRDLRARLGANDECPSNAELDIEIEEAFRAGPDNAYWTELDYYGDYLMMQETRAFFDELDRRDYGDDESPDYPEEPWY